MTTPLDVHCFVDPLDPRGWGSQPAIRRLRAAVPEAIWRYHPVVLVPDWDRYDGPEFPGGRESVAAVCSRVSEDSGMPIDEFLWFEDAPATSAPACAAVGAVLDADLAAGRRFLRAAREATFVGRRNLDGTDALATLADRVDGVDPDVVADAAAEAEESAPSGTLGDGPDFDPTDVQGVAAAGERPELPTVVVAGPDGRRGHSGLLDEARLRHLLTAVGVEDAAPDLSVHEALDAHSEEGWLAVAELTALADVSYEDAVAAARERDDVTEREFAAEPFFRVSEFVTAAGGEGASETGDGDTGAPEPSNPHDAPAETTR